MGRSGGSGGFSGGGRSSGGFSGGFSGGGRSFGNPSGGFRERPRQPLIVPVIINTTHEQGGGGYGSGMPPGGGSPLPDRDAPERRRKRRRIILIAIAAFVLLSGLMGVASSCAGTHIDGTPLVEREALPAGAVVETGYYTDEDGDWIHDASKLESGLRAFYQKTGVQPYVYILPNGSSTDLTAFAEQQYDQLFRDEGHFLLVFCDNGNGGFACGYAMGTQVSPIMDSAAIDILADNVDKYYRNPYLSEEEIFSKAFADTADTIMEKDDYLVGSIACIVIVLVPVLAYGGYRVFRIRRERQEREQRLQQEILNTPLEKFGDQEVEDLAKKYADDAPAAAPEVSFEKFGDQYVEDLAEKYEENISDHRTGD